MAAKEEDPFASLIGLCKPTNSQELKLGNCSFTRNSETFTPMDSDSDCGCDSDFETSAPVPTQSQPQGTGIFMLSLPHTDSEGSFSDIDKNTPDNEVFQTPPEHHNRRSSSSSQELLSQPEKLISGATQVLEETARVDDVVRLGGEEETLGFLATQVLDGGDRVMGGQCWKNVQEVEKIAGFEEDETGEPMSKKIRVSEENMNCHTLSADETGVTEKVDCAVDCEDTYEGLVVNKISSPVVRNAPTKVSENNNSTNSSSHLLKNLGLISDGKGEINGGEASLNSQYVGSNDVQQERLEEKALEEDTAEQFPVSNLDCETERIEDTEKLNDCSFDGGVVDNGKVYENCLIDNVGLSEKVFTGKARYDVPDAIRNGSEGPSRSKTAEEIESFRYEEHESDRNNRAGASKGRRELPLSIRGKETDAEVVDKPRNTEAKELSFLELLDACEVFFNFKTVDGSPEELDFLETAKRRGMTFPEPRWR